MQTFTIEALAKSYDGTTQPFHGRVEAPFADPARGYVCAFECSLFGGGQFHSPYPEWTYAAAASFIRFELEMRQHGLVDAQDRPVEFQAPVADEYGIGCFPEARFRGQLHKPDGKIEAFTAAVRPPLRDQASASDPRPLWRCEAKCSVLEIKSPIASEWPEHAYEMAFTFLRTLLGHFGRITDMKGRPLLLRAPIKA